MTRHLLIVFFIFLFSVVHSQNKKLYFVKDSTLYSIDLTNKAISNIYTVPNKYKPKSCSKIKYRNNTFSWPIFSNNKLIILKNDSISEISILVQKELDISYNFSNDTTKNYIDKYFDDFIISPDGLSVIWNVDYDIKFGPDTCFKKHKIFSYSLNDKIIKTIFEENYIHKGIKTGTWDKRQLVAWPIKSKIYFNTINFGQLNTSQKYLTSYNLSKNKKSSVYSKIERVLFIDKTCGNIYYTNTDETCCAGLNYTNNKIYYYDQISLKSKLIFDEYLTYKNNKCSPPVSENDNKLKDFIPQLCSTSPNGSVVGFSLLGIKNWNASSFSWITWIKSLNNQFQQIQLEEKIIIGWLNNYEVIVAEKKSNNMNDLLLMKIYIFNLHDKKFVELPIENIIYVGMDE